ncbi:uncharacterized protein APUU_40015S [Aspergillus puulaauensis]|uniref:Six-bladed beta-propeller-like protein n=1 Tax=Aspergillus puulaauensis TaxID=1220207 RepID=A0A7R7XLA1_9EURO|nr:uncharacterized protein APUU_40015S [Aspergillus puulaauensis]BCS23571.1 hypothetical protein APUU_40015S [Aspergillus puulaauensis]
MFAFVLLLLTVLTTGVLGVHAPSLHEVYQFPNATWVENIAVRPNGNLLVTLVNTPELWEIDPSVPHKASRARFIHQFSNAEMATGIAELNPDVYAVVASNHVWKVDLTHSKDKEPPTLISRIPHGSLNGMTVLNREAGLLAIADSQLGLVWCVDANTGNYSVMLKDDTMAANTDVGTLLGINGVRMLHNYIYYVNTPLRLYCRVRVDRLTGHAVGPYEIISKGVRTDDFTIGPDAVAYLAGLDDNVVARALLDGTQEIIAGGANSSAVQTATSAALGRNEKANTLYVTTGGNTTDLSGYTGRGKIVAIALDA